MPVLEVRGRGGGTPDPGLGLTGAVCEMQHGQGGDFRAVSLPP